MLATANCIIHNEKIFPLKPYQLVSLWDVLKFYPHRFLGMNHALDVMRSLFARDGCLRDGDFSKGGKDREGLKAILKALHVMLSELNLSMSAKQALFIKDTLEYVDQVDQGICDLTFELYRRIKDEFENQTFLMIPTEKAKFYESDMSIWGAEVETKFSNLIYDMDEASKCYALNRSTACVFHLMRIMEGAVQKLGDHMGVLLTEEKAWQVIINLIRGKINVKYPDTKSTDRINFESILGQLETIKIAWRNPTMHPKSTYTEEEAAGILQATRIFMQDFAKLV